MGPFKCPDCGVWWAGFEHRCSPMYRANTTTPTIVPTDPPFRDYGSTLAPYCGLCGTYHIPGAGPCTGTYSGLTT